MEIITTSAQETQKLGEKIGNSLIKKRSSNVACVLLLFGELGSGKTTFVQGLAKSLGLPHRIISPTYILIKRYTLKNSSFSWFYHIDLYRLHAGADTESLDLPNIFRDPSAIVCVEWPERLEQDFPQRVKRITFAAKDGDTRVITTE